jgi:hypothetical protein
MTGGGCGDGNSDGGNSNRDGGNSSNVNSAGSSGGGNNGRGGGDKRQCQCQQLPINDSNEDNMPRMCVEAKDRNVASAFSGSGDDGEKK